MSIHDVDAHDPPEGFAYFVTADEAAMLYAVLGVSCGEVLQNLYNQCSRFIDEYEPDLADRYQMMVTAVEWGIEIK